MLRYFDAWQRESPRFYGLSIRVSFFDLPPLQRHYETLHRRLVTGLGLATRHPLERKCNDRGARAGLAVQ